LNVIVVISVISIHSTSIGIVISFRRNHLGWQVSDDARIVIKKLIGTTVFTRESLKISYKEIKDNNNNNKQTNKQQNQLE
jgi:hypothetical protein